MNTRREEKEARRRERLERERAAAAAQRRRKLLGYGAGGAVAAGALVALIVLLLAGGGGGGGEARGGEGDFPPPGGPLPPPRITELKAAAQAAGCTVRSDVPEGGRHVTRPVRYRSNPPHSGDHFEIPTEDGPYVEAPPSEQLVHALEHGRIVIQHRPGAPEGVRGDLKALFDEDPYHMILVPNGTNMPFEVAATAWGRLLGCRAMNPQVFDAIRTFRDRYRDKGPEYVP